MTARGPGPLLMLAMLAAASAGPVAAQEPAYAPCLLAHDEAGDYVEAFLAEGWMPVEGPERVPALRGLAEVSYLRTRDLNYDDLRSAEALARGIARAEAALADEAGDAAVLARDGAVMVVRAWHPVPGSVICVLTAPDLPEVEALFASGEVRRLADALTYVGTSPPRPRGASYLVVEAMRHARPSAPGEPEAGLEAVVVSLSVDGAS